MRKAVIMGGGPAGLAAGYKLIHNGFDVTLFEADSQVGGISKTIQHQGYYFDLGGHRFFTKFNEVNEFWHEVLGEKFVTTPRLSRIYYRNKYFNYPLTPMNALFGVGVLDTFLILLSYIQSKIFPYSNEETFEQWVANRFGKKLYSIFFKTYTEKVWGIPCSLIQAEWAAQRIKGLSLITAITNAIFKPKNTNIKTLIDEFNYPLYGPGMMYNEVKNKLETAGAKVNLNSRIIKVNHENYSVKSIEYLDAKGNRQVQEGTDFISSIPITELIRIIYPVPEKSIIEAAEGLKYRSFIIVGIVINKKDVFPDNWIYIHSPEVKLGRIQNFKNWSKHMVPDTNKTSLGLEYFCTENDDFWNLTDQEIFQVAAREVEQIKICKAVEIESYIVTRVPKAYPVYMMGYQKQLKLIKDFLSRFHNLHPIGRYGLFKYNNMDHSILTGFYAAQNVILGRQEYDTWNVNTDEEYHEEIKNKSNCVIEV